MSEQEQASEPVWEKVGQAGLEGSHGAVKYHLLPEAKLREPHEAPLSIEERHQRSQQVAKGLRAPVESAAEREARLVAEQQEKELLAAYQVEKDRREAEQRAKELAEARAWRESQKAAQPN